MLERPTRRRFLRSTAGAAAALGLPALDGLLPLMGADRAATIEPVRFDSDLEPIVRLIEDTPRERCVAALVAELRRGLPYRRFLAAVFLTAVRKSNSHHSVYLVNSAHQVSLDLRPEERLLPLFWAVDHFKWQQHEFPTPPLERLAGDLPNASVASAEFHEGMRRGQLDRAERSLVAVARSDGPRQA